MSSDLYITVQSANRPHQVAFLQAALAPLTATWYVPAGQEAQYRAAGATTVVAVPGQMPMKSKQLNAALDDGFAQGRTVLTMDDDYEWVRVLLPDETGRKRSGKAALPEAIAAACAELEGSPWLCGGFQPSTHNLSAEHETSWYGWIVGGFLFHRPSGVRFDESLPMLEDLDYVIAQHTAAGGVCRINRYLIRFHMFGRLEESEEHHTGGFAGFRDDQTYYDTLFAIIRKWGHPAVSSRVVAKESRKGFRGRGYPAPHIRWKELTA